MGDKLNVAKWLRGDFDEMKRTDINDFLHDRLKETEIMQFSELSETEKSLEYAKRDIEKMTTNLNKSLSLYVEGQNTVIENLHNVIEHKDIETNKLKKQLEDYRVRLIKLQELSDKTDFSDPKIFIEELKFYARP